VTAEEARRLFATARVARLATVGPGGAPHLVPMVFALDADTVFSAVDAKPKRTTKLRRLDHVRADPRVTLLADHYEDDWTALWWVRADGRGRVIDPGEPDAQHAVARLAARYEQYAATPPAGPVLAIDVERWTGWRAR
jgi:PPOX class probable F420-dependent enzyme